MIDLVSNKLSELGYKVQWQSRPKKFPSITFQFPLQTGEEFSDDEETVTKYILHVDIWSKNDYSELTAQVKEKLKEIGFYRTMEMDDYEEETQIYHKILKFNYYEDNESEDDI